MTILSKQKRSTRGFTLIEALVGTFVITSVILGPLSVALDSSSHAKLSKDVITGTYLAAEAIELLHYKQDSIFLDCLQSISTLCVLAPGESARDAAWRIFAESLSSPTTPCDISNPDGCSFDFIRFVSSVNAISPTGGNSTPCTRITYTLAGIYTCPGTGETSNDISKVTSFTRSITTEILPTIGVAGGVPGSPEAIDRLTNSDIRVAVTVAFAQPNGYIRKIELVDFLRAR